MNTEHTEKALPEQEPKPELLQKQDNPNPKSVEQEVVAGIVKEIQDQAKHKALSFYGTLAAAIASVILSSIAIGFSCDANKTAHDTYIMEYNSKLPQISGALSINSDENGKTNGDSIRVISGGGQLSEFHMTPYATLILYERSGVSWTNSSEDCIHYRTSTGSLYDYVYTYDSGESLWGYDFTTDISTQDSLWDRVKGVLNFGCSRPSSYGDTYYYPSVSSKNTTNNARYSLYEPIYVPLYNYFKDGEYNGNTEGLLVTKSSNDGNYSKVKAKIDDINTWYAAHGLQRSYTGTIDIVLYINYKDFSNARRYLYLAVDKNGSYEIDPVYFQDNFNRVQKCMKLLHEQGLQYDICKLKTDDLVKWLDTVIDRSKSSGTWGTSVQLR